MKCANCIFYENDICYRKGIRVLFNNNICKDFVCNNINNNEIQEES